MATNYILEQYKLLTSSFNDEITRFWSRFNILFGVEIIGLIGILNSLKILSSNIVLFRLTLILMILYSTSTFLIVWRGFMMHQNILKTLLIFEKKSEGKLEILKLSKSNSKIPIGFNQIIAISISCVFTIFWISLFLFFEINKYNVVILP